MKDPFDSDIEAAIAALDSHAKETVQNRKRFIKRITPYAVGLIIFSMVGVIIAGIGTNLKNQSINKQHELSEQLLANNTVVDNIGAQTNTSDSEVTSSSDNDYTDDMPAQLFTEEEVNSRLNAEDTALRFAYTWINQGGGIDSTLREEQLRAMTAKNVTIDFSSGQEGIREHGSIQVVLSAHIARYHKTNDKLNVDVAVLLAGTSSPEWAILQIPLGKTDNDIWAVISEPSWQPLEEAGNTTVVTYAAKPQDQTDLKIHSDIENKIENFLTKYGSTGLIDDTNLVKTPLNGLDMNLHLDHISKIIPLDQNTVLTTVIWSSDTGEQPPQTYTITLSDNKIVSVLGAM